MNNRTVSTDRRIALLPVALGSIAALALGFATPASAVDKSDFTTTASTAGTTAYIVGKNVDKDDLARARDFSDSRAQALRSEAAAGEGEHLDSLAALLGESDSQRFGRWMQLHYGQLYPDNAQQQANLADRIVAMR